LPPKWCPQTPYPRPSTAPAGRKRPAKTSSRRQPKPRQAWKKPPAIQIENAGFSSSSGWPEEPPARVVRLVRADLRH